MPAMRTVRQEASRPQMAARLWEPALRTATPLRARLQTAICTRTTMATFTRTRDRVGRSTTTVVGTTCKSQPQLRHSYSQQHPTSTNPNYSSAQQKAQSNPNYSADQQRAQSYNQQHPSGDSAYKPSGGSSYGDLNQEAQDRQRGAQQSQRFSQAQHSGGWGGGGGGRSLGGGGGRR